MGMTTYFYLKKSYTFLAFTPAVMRIVGEENKSQ